MHRSAPLPDGPTPLPSLDAGEAPMRLNVLVVDDSAVMRTMVIRALRMSGLPIGDVHEAANGAEALRVLEECWVDLATVDINMAVMTGDELIERLRATPETASLPVVVISSEANDDRIRDLERRGAAFVRKPFVPESLRETVLRLLGVGHV
jgi:two-component system chemotaxis response regulator CheY